MYEFDAKAPGGGVWQFTLAKERLESLRVKGWERKYFDSLLIRDTLSNPTAIFEGLNRETQERSLCYCHVPTVRYWDDTTTVPPPAGKVFLVFADCDRRIFGWRWEPCDDKHHSLPIDYQARFTQQLWPR